MSTQKNNGKLSSHDQAIVHDRAVQSGRYEPPLTGNAARFLDETDEGLRFNVFTLISDTEETKAEIRELQERIYEAKARIHTQELRIIRELVEHDQLYLLKVDWRSIRNAANYAAYVEQNANTKWG